jgi:hypothetical protein
MTPITDLIRKHGSQQKLADLMGVHQSQIARWVKLGAMVCPLLGEVWLKSRDVKPILE